MAETPMELPPGEDPQVWLEPMALGGLEPGSPDGDAWVVLDSAGATWRLQVRDGAGVVHVVDVPRARTSGEREDIVWLAVSFLQPLEIGTAPPEPDVSPQDDSSPIEADPSPAPRSPRNRVPPGSADVQAGPEPPLAPDAVPADAAADAPEAVEREGAGEAPAVEERPEVVEELDPDPLDLGVRGGAEVLVVERPLRLWAEVGALGILRNGVNPGAAVRAGVGMTTGRGWELGLVVHLAGRTLITNWGQDRHVDWYRDLEVGIWRTARPLPIRPGVAAGVSYRRFDPGGSEPWTQPIPTLRAHVGIPIRVARNVRVEPWVSAQVDLWKVPYVRFEDQEPEGQFPLLAAQGGIALRLGIPAGAAADSRGGPSGTGSRESDAAIDQIEPVRALPGR